MPVKICKTILRDPPKFPKSTYTPNITFNHTFININYNFL